VGAIAEKPTHVTEDDVGLRKRAREVDHVGDLRIEDPGIERQTERCQPRHAGAEIRSLVKPRAGTHGAVADDGVGVPGSAMPHAAKTAAAGSDLSLEHRGDAIAEREVGETHDAGAYPRRAVLSAVAHCGAAGTEFEFAHRSHL